MTRLIALSQHPGHYHYQANDIVVSFNLRRAVEGLTVPMRAILDTEYGSVFGREEVSSLTAAFDAALNKFGLVDRRTQ